MKNILIFCLKIFNFSVINFSVYLNRRVFLMVILSQYMTTDVHRRRLTLPRCPPVHVRSNGLCIVLKYIPTNDANVAFSGPKKCLTLIKERNMHNQDLAVLYSYLFYILFLFLSQTNCIEKTSSMDKILH